MISFILPTHDRPARLARTLAALGSLAGGTPGGAEVIIADNASRTRPRLPRRLANGLPVRLLSRPCNEAAASRNAAAAAATGTWLVMLDDDSYPQDLQFVGLLEDAPPEVAAIGARITLPGGGREAGGLPEVFVGCGAAVRRAAFLDAGGYDATFHYYAEEYDLCARLLGLGYRIVHDQRFRVRHEKVGDGRDMNVILHRLVRNNGWVAARYAPPARRDIQLRREIARYAGIAVLESAQRGYLAGLAELLQTIDRQPSRHLPRDLFDRFTGLTAARQGLGAALARARRVAVVDEGKNAWVVREVLNELGLEITPATGDADAVVIGTLSPGPMLDAWERRGGQAVMPWVPEAAPRVAAVGAGA